MHLPEDLRKVVTETRARIHVRFPWWLRPFLQRGVVAITIGRRIYLGTEERAEEVLRHELTHVRQIARVGMVRFYWTYFAEYIALRRRGLSPAEAYRSISWEVEAYASEKTL